MKYINPRILITLRSKVITSIFFIVLFSAYIYAFATPPGSPYTPGATLDPACAPSSTNCFVQIIPDQTGNVGKYLTTDGSVTSWVALTGVTQWVTTGSDIYYPTGNVGIGTTTPTEALDITGNINLTNDGTDRYIQSGGNNSPNGSSIFIVAGNGQSLSAGVGGNLNLRGGNGTGGMGPGSGGDVLIDGGGKSGFGEVGNILLGTIRQGKVGIGTASPVVELDVVGDVSLAKSVTYVDGLLSLSSTGDWLIGDWAGSVNNTQINGSDSLGTIEILAPNGTTLNGGTVKIFNLAGTGTRTVLADSTGTLSAPVSDRSVKQNIQSLDYGLSTLMQLNPVSFEYIDGWKNYGIGKQIGFIAQDIQQVLPNSAFTTPQTGKMGYNEIDLVPVVVKAVQEMNIRIEGLSSLDTTSSTSLGSLIKQFLGNVGNSIEVVFFGEVHTKKLCLEEVCITKDQLQQIINNSNANSGGGSGGGNPPETPPADICPNIDGDQATVPDNMHLDSNNNCVANEITPPPVDPPAPVDGDTPPAETPPDNNGTQ